MSKDMACFNQRKSTYPALVVVRLPVPAPLWGEVCTHASGESTAAPSGTLPAQRAEVGTDAAGMSMAAPSGTAKSTMDLARLGPIRPQQLGGHN